MLLSQEAGVLCNLFMHLFFKGGNGHKTFWILASLGTSWLIRECLGRQLLPSGSTGVIPVVGWPPSFPLSTHLSVIMQSSLRSSNTRVTSVLLHPGSLLAFSGVPSVWISLPKFPCCYLQDILELMGCSSVMSLLIAFSVSALISPFLPSYIWLTSFCCLCLLSFPLSIGRITWIHFSESLIFFHSLGSVVNYIYCMCFLS